MDSRKQATVTQTWALTAATATYGTPEHDTWHGNSGAQGDTSISFGCAVEIIRARHTRPGHNARQLLSASKQLLFVEVVCQHWGHTSLLSGGCSCPAPSHREKAQRAKPWRRGKNPVGKNNLLRGSLGRGSKVGLLVPPTRLKLRIRFSPLNPSHPTGEGKGRAGGLKIEWTA